MHNRQIIHCFLFQIVPTNINPAIVMLPNSNKYLLLLSFLGELLRKVEHFTSPLNSSVIKSVVSINFFHMQSITIKIITY